MSKAPTASRLYHTRAKPRVAFELGGEGPLLLLLHGIGGTRHDWRDQMATLTTHYSVAAWDARGYGDSDDFEGPFDFDDVATDLVRVLDTLNVRRAHLVGLSMGGMIAQWFWHRYPQRVASLVLADTTIGPAASLTEDTLTAFLAARRAPLLDGVPMAEIAARNASQLLAPGAPSERLERVKASFASVRLGTYLRSLEAVVRFRGVPNLEEIAVPTLVLVGEHDQSLPPALSRALADRIPGAQYRVIPGAGHISNVDTPEQFDAAVFEFLSTHAQL